jgi:hypothetical protein
VPKLKKKKKYRLHNMYSNLSHWEKKSKSNSNRKEEIMKITVKINEM